MSSRKAIDFNTKVMAYVDRFNYDIFISYDHDDDLPMPGGGEGWVTSFHEYLEYSLKRRYSEIVVWRDIRQLQGHERFDSKIQKAIDESAVFLALTSTNYFNSDYCKQERALFVSKAKKEPLGLVVEDQERLFNILLRNIPYEKWPEEFEGRTGFPFHDAEDDELGAPSQPSRDKFSPFGLQLRELADAIERLLDTLKKRGGRYERQAPSLLSGQVFMAKVSDELWTKRKRIIGNLEEKGIRVVTESGLRNLDEAAHDDKVKAVLGGVDLSVHLLDRSAGRPINEATGETYRQRQVKLAIKHAKSYMIWLPRNEVLDIDAVENEQHKAFLHWLNGVTYKQEEIEAIPDEKLRAFVRGLASEDYEKHAHFIRSSPAEISGQIITILEQLQQAEEEGSTKPTCLIDTRRKYNKHAYDIATKLEKGGIETTLNQDETNLELFRMQLEKNKNLIIFCGEDAVDQVKGRVETARKIPTVKKLGVFLVPPKALPKGGHIQLGLLYARAFNQADAVINWLRT